ncbi:GntR family transcriptional regulator [Virgibacillus soli]|uniref:GntR family transcriptional regulator n=1 Tax=Paracerasibacillus soli TaxID=480284 RepID=UPI0035EC4C21
MKLDVDSIKPIYIQIAEWIENKILEGTFQQDEKVFSQYQLAEKFNINPATAAKGLHMLSEEDILYTKRGLGKFVKEGAKERIRDKRINETLVGLIHDLVKEARYLNVSDQQLMNMIKSASNQEGE